jgi:hypothetical protein
MKSYFTLQMNVIKLTFLLTSVDYYFCYKGVDRVQERSLGSLLSETDPGNVIEELYKKINKKSLWLLIKDLPGKSTKKKPKSSVSQSESGNTPINPFRLLLLVLDGIFMLINTLILLPLDLLLRAVLIGFSEVVMGIKRLVSVFRKKSATGVDQSKSPDASPDNLPELLEEFSTIVSFFRSLAFIMIVNAVMHFGGLSPAFAWITISLLALSFLRFALKLGVDSKFRKNCTAKFFTFPYIVAGLLLLCLSFAALSYSIHASIPSALLFAKPAILWIYNTMTTLMASQIFQAIWGLFFLVAGISIIFKLIDRLVDAESCLHPVAIFVCSAVLLPIIIIEPFTVLFPIAMYIHHEHYRSAEKSCHQMIKTLSTLERGGELNADVVATEATVLALAPSASASASPSAKAFEAELTAAQSIAIASRKMRETEARRACEKQA